MSVTKRPTPAPVISFKISINVRRFLSPSLVWHGSLNTRLFLNDQLSVPDQLQSQPNTLGIQQNQKLTLPATTKGSICMGQTLPKPAIEDPGPDQSASRGTSSSSGDSHCHSAPTRSQMAQQLRTQGTEPIPLPQLYRLPEYKE